MKYVLLLALTILGTTLFSYGGDSDKSTYVLIETSMGNITIKLYDDTPEHQMNFMKLVKQGFYNGTLFHRCINDFMIQGGDPESKGAQAGTPLGNGGPGYRLPAEIRPNHIHKAGALAAARQGDNVNPKKESSGSQFYIVTGRVYPEADIEKMNGHYKQQKEREIARTLVNKPENAAFKERIVTCQKTKDQAGFQKVMEELAPLVALEMEKPENKSGLTEEQIKAYTTVGGTPHLDGSYTVFGEVIDGLDVAFAIAAMPGNAQNRPTKDIEMKMKIIKKP